ncbi:EamA family transporter [Candidatus Dojkabacteria bacterium]|nr:EamA family transporter [Candidatus Dojkabacteria bacterium]
MILVTVSIVIANLEDLRKTGKISKYSWLALLGGFLFGIGYTFDKKYVLDLNPHVYSLLLYCSMAFMNALFAGRRIIADFKAGKVTGNFLKSVVLAGLAYFIYSRFTFMSYYHGGKVGSVDAINNAVVITLIPLEILFLRDRSNLVLKIVSAIICFIGIVFLG